MSPEKRLCSLGEHEGNGVTMNLKETELTLGLPGASSSREIVNGGKTAGTKRGFLDTVDLSLGSSRKEECADSMRDHHHDDCCTGKAPASKAPVVGWPPVRAYRKNALTKGAGESCKYVKVAVDGAPYLRKVDLEMYNSYQQLLSALEDMFSCLTIRNYLSKRKIVDEVNGGEYVPTYEDKDGDWMMVGDVPWKMFVDSCKRLRLMKSSEAIGLAPRTPSKCSSTS